MKKMISKVALAVLFSSCLSIAPSYCYETNAIVYEKALMKYVLAHEALQKAKQDPNKKSQLPLYLRKYRESYAQYLELMRKNDLYRLDDTEFINDPAGNFNNTIEERGMPQQKFEAFDTSSARQKISKKVENGEDVDSAVESETSNSVPKKGYSKINFKLYGWNLDCDGYGEKPSKWKDHWPKPEGWRGGPRPKKENKEDDKDNSSKDNTGNENSINDQTFQPSQTQTSTQTNTYTGS